MKIVIESCGTSVQDENFKKVQNVLKHMLCQKGYQMVPAGIELSFACLVPTGFEDPNPDRINIRYTKTEDLHQHTYLQSIALAVEKMGRVWNMRPSDHL